MQLVTDPVVRAEAASQLVNDIAVVTSHVLADTNRTYLMHLGPGRTQPAPAVRVLRACGLEGVVTTRGKPIGEWDIPSLQRIVRWVLFDMDWARNYRSLTPEESNVQAAACRLSDAIEPLAGTLGALNMEGTR